MTAPRADRLLGAVSGLGKVGFDAVRKAMERHPGPEILNPGAGLGTEAGGVGKAPFMLLEFARESGPAAGPGS